MRYSIDYTATQMTTKFLLFDYLFSTHLPFINPTQKIKLIINCFIANLTSTLLSQIAFNYQIISSSFPIDKKTHTENIKNRLLKYTKDKKIPIDGLKYTLPISIINTAL
jgi:hypothetical protein